MPKSMDPSRRKFLKTSAAGITEAVGMELCAAVDVLYGWGNWPRRRASSPAAK